MASIFQKPCVLRVCHLQCSEFESIDPHTMRWLLVIAARVAAHLKPAFRNVAHHWFGEWRAAKIQGCHLRAPSVVTGSRTAFVGEFFEKLFGRCPLRGQSEF